MAGGEVLGERPGSLCGGRLSVVVPVYNEAFNISILVGRLVEVLDRTDLAFEVIVVDDDSPDRTWEIAGRLAAEEPRLRVLRRCGERGLATAVVHGWRHARGDLLAVMDADLQHPPEALPALLEAMEREGADIAIASRYLAEGSLGEGCSLFRRALSATGVVVARRLLSQALSGVTDPLSGYFVVRRAVVERLDLRPRGYKILLEVLGRARGAKVVEVPFRFGRRERGTSKLGVRQQAEFLGQMFALWWRTRGATWAPRPVLAGASRSGGRRRALSGSLARRPGGG